MRPGKRYGSYVLRRPLGAGGMGAVWVAEDPGLGREVALKLLHLDRGSGVEARFEREAEALGRVAHPCVARVFAAGVEEGQPWLATELVPGVDLERLCQQEGPLEPRRAAALVRDLAGALQAVHRAGVLHRDLKPGNVLLRPDGRPALVDFGLARLSGVRSLTESGVLLGTPAYAAPEQLESAADADARADVYGLGAVLYHLLTARAPFQAAYAVQVIRAVLHQDPPWPASLRPEVPAGLDAIVRRAMAKRPGERFPGAEELARALEAWLAGEAPPARTRGGLRTRAALLLGAVALACLLLVRLRAGSGPAGAGGTPAPPASAGERRLEGPPAGPSRSPVAADPCSRYRAALAGGDAGALHALNRAPLARRFDGKAQPRDAARVWFLDEQRLLVAHRSSPKLWVWDLARDEAREAASLPTGCGVDGLACLRGQVFASSGSDVFRFELGADPLLGWTLAPREPSEQWLDTQRLVASHGARALTEVAARGTRLLVGGSFAEAFLLDLGGGEPEVLKGHALAITDVSLAPGGERLATVTSRGTDTSLGTGGAWAVLRAWDVVPALAPAGEWQVDSQLDAVELIAADELVVGSVAGHLRRFSLPIPPGAEGRLLGQTGLGGAGLVTQAAAVAELAWQPARRGFPGRLWSGTHNSFGAQSLEGPVASTLAAVEGWDLQRGQAVRRIVVQDDVRALEVSPDGALLAVGLGNGTVEVWGTSDD